ncbi:MAG: CCA tRNA nucleotidyltransferase [Alphaproteobacteria bacterium]
MTGAQAPLPRLEKRAAPWLFDSATVSVLEALQAPGEDHVRFVGGCVRNALLGHRVEDLDLATIHRPETVMTRLEARGLKAVPTGLAHGTVTAVASGRPFEITSLRRDVATDGRRAVVAFTEDWTEDARRRDFTMNALYLSADGQVHDPLGGYADLAARRVRFIGDARTRIREDYLRALRFFRIHAWYGTGAFDGDGLAAIAEEAKGVATLSGERVHREMLKVLEADAPGPALITMEQIGLLSIVLPGGFSIDRFAALKNAEAALGLKACAVRRLAALVRGDGAALADLWRLSKAHRLRLLDLLNAAPEEDLSEPSARRLVYRVGAERARDRIVWTAMAGARHLAEAKKALEIAATWTAPPFPLTGADAIAAGLTPGPAMGTVLAALEAEWIAADFKPDREALKRRLASLAAAT